MLTGGLTSTTCGAERERPLVERRVTTPTHAPSPPGRGHWSRAAACSRSSKASLPAAPPAPPAQQQQRAQLVRQPQWCPWLRATKKKRARHEHEQQRRPPDVLRNSGGERSEGGGAVPDECHRSSAPQRVFRLRAASCAPAAPLGQRVPPYKRPRPAFRPVEHRCRPPAHSWARRWVSACSCTATPCASCRCCAVRARLRSQRAANGPVCANPKRNCICVRRRPLGARRGRGPRRHGRLVRGCLGGARSTLCSRPSFSRHRTTLTQTHMLPGLQERVTKEVADLEAKRAKRFAGARA